MPGSLHLTNENLRNPASVEENYDTFFFLLWRVISWMATLDVFLAVTDYIMFVKEKEKKKREK